MAFVMLSSICTMVETNTNQLLRKKYFVDKAEVISADADAIKRPGENYSRIIHASEVEESSNPVLLRPQGKKEDDRIKVNVVRDGDTVKGINIQCSCGRHADVNFEYSPSDAGNEGENG